MSRDIYIAVDGPASSGKTATFAQVAKRLNLAFIDTGLFYRAFCWSVIFLNISLEDEDKLAQALREWKIRFEGDDLVYVKIGDHSEQECSAHLHTHDIDSKVSIVAKHPKVRSSMVECQRKIAEASKPCIVLGRDITSVVLPNAKVKIYLDSSVKVRADRRYAQLKRASESGGGAESEYKAIYDALEARDKLDKDRPVGPLTRTPDSMYLNNDALTLEEAVDEAVKMIEPFLAS